VGPVTKPTDTHRPGTRAAAKAILDAAELTWLDPAVDIYDTLLAAGWTDAQAERAMAWLR
jgi:hypothetical protein